MMFRLMQRPCFAADNNALEVRSLNRSGPTKVPQVQKARDAYFNDPIFVNKGIRDKYAFDGDMDTQFKFRIYTNKFLNRTRRPGLFRIDFSKEIQLNKLVLKGVPDTLDLQTAQISTDLKNWQTIPVNGEGDNRVIQLQEGQPVRYIRTDNPVLSVAEIEGYKDGEKLDRSRWKASNLFGSFKKRPAIKAWTYTFKLDEVAKSSYLAVPAAGKYGNESVYAALRVNGNLVGAPDRSISYQSNTWEYPVRQPDGNYTYFFPLTPEMVGKTVEVIVLGF